MNYMEESLKYHKKWAGKFSVIPKMDIESYQDLALAYTPGVATSCLEIQKNPDLSYELTGRWNTVAVISDGTAVLGLGDIGPEASMPVMEGKAVLFKRFGDIDAIPLCIKTKNADEIINIIAALEGSFGGVNLEDISAPRCFEIEQKLKERCSIPVFHDDQHGTAIVVLSAIINSLKLSNKQIKDITIVINGAGSAGIAIAKLLNASGASKIIMCDTNGAIYKTRDNLNPQKKEIAVFNTENKSGSLSDVIRGADVFIGVSKPGVLTPDMIKTMAQNPIIFALANPFPEILPDLAIDAGAYIVGTGRSDFPNQINNVLAFPGVFRGALDVRASQINEEMKIAAAYAIASLVGDDELCPEKIIPSIFDERLKDTVSKAVSESARKTGVARI